MESNHLPGRGVALVVPSESARRVAGTLAEDVYIRRGFKITDHRRPPRLADS